MAEKTPKVETQDKFLIDFNHVAPEKVPHSTLEYNAKTGSGLHPTGTTKFAVKSSPKHSHDFGLSPEPDSHDDIGQSSNEPRRKKPWLIALIVVIVILVIVAAVLGGVLGSRAASNNNGASTGSVNPSSSSPGAGESNTTYIVEPWFVREGSPLTLVPGDAWDQTNVSNGVNSHSLFYQAANGSLALTGRSSSEWYSDSSILTDQYNGTGIAATTYSNGTDQQYNVYYIGSSTMNIREKRQQLSNNYWDLGPLTAAHLPVPGPGIQNLSLAAVYTGTYFDGPRMSLYWHCPVGNSLAINESRFQNGNWTLTGQVVSAVGIGHIDAVFEESTNHTRLFRAAGNDIAEITYNNSDSQAQWLSGVNLSDVLPDPAASFTAMTDGNTTFIYYVMGQGPNIQIMEQELPPAGSGSTTYPDRKVVASPNIGVAGMDNSTLLASYTVGAIAKNGTVTVVFPEDGFSAMVAVTRAATGDWQSNTIIESVPLT